MYQISSLYYTIVFFASRTDSRLGIGFRIGPNADLQVQWELGPQENSLTSRVLRKSKKSINKTDNDVIDEKQGSSTSTPPPTPPPPTPPPTTPTPTPSPSPPSPSSSENSLTSLEVSTRSQISNKTRSTGLRKINHDPDYGVKRLTKTLLSLFKNT